MMENYTDVLFCLETLLSTQSLCEMSTEFNMWWPKTTLRRLKRNIEETRGRIFWGMAMKYHHILVFMISLLLENGLLRGTRSKHPMFLVDLGKFGKNGMLGFLGPIKVGVD